MSESEINTDETSQLPEMLPVLPLRDVVVYPHMVIPLFVGREKSIEALDAAMAKDKRIILAAQTSAAIDEPGPDDIHTVGTVATILQLLKLPNSTIKVLVEGQHRVELTNSEYVDAGFFRSAYIQPEVELGEESDKATATLMRSVTNMFDQYVKMNKKIPPEILSSIAGVDDPDRLADMIAAQMSLKVEEKQKILELFNPAMIGSNNC